MHTAHQTEFNPGTMLKEWLQPTHLVVLLGGMVAVALFIVIAGLQLTAAACLLLGTLILTYKIPSWMRTPILGIMFLSLMVLIQALTNMQIVAMVAVLSAGVFFSNREGLMPDQARYILCAIVLLMMYAIPVALFGMALGIALGLVIGTLYVLMLQIPGRYTRLFFAVIGLSLVALVIDVFGLTTTLVVVVAGAFLLLYNPRLQTPTGRLAHTIVTIALIGLGLTVFADALGGPVVGLGVSVVISIILLTPGQIGGQMWERGLISRLELQSVYGRAVYRMIMIGLVLLAVTVVFPFLFTFTAGLKTPRGIYTSGLQLWPDEPIWSTYQRAWERFDIVQLLRNTFTIVIGSVAMQIGISTLAAYSLSRLRPVGGRFIMLGFLLTLMIPSIAYLVPLYVTATELNLLGSYWGIWLPAGVNAFMIFILKSFFDNLPSELFDAAKVDGANALQILWRIVLPLSRPILLVVSILTFVNFWKDFLWPYLILLTKPELQPIAVKLYVINETTNVPMNMQMAAYFMAMLPPLIVAILLQRYMQQGLSLGAVKG